MGRRFTIVELMMAVAIVGILAALGASQVSSYQYRAKRSEIYVNVPSMMDAVKAYHVGTDKLPSSEMWQPVGLAVIGKEARDWGFSSQITNVVGWRPDGQVRGTYSLTVTGGPQVSIGGYTDVDGDSYWHVHFMNYFPTTETLNVDSDCEVGYPGGECY